VREHKRDLANRGWSVTYSTAPAIAFFRAMNDHMGFNLAVGPAAVAEGL
jgi:hypothetical protein